MRSRNSFVRQAERRPGGVPPPPRSEKILPGQPAGTPAFRWSERGASCGEVAFILLIILVVIGVLWGLAESCGKTPPGRPPVAQAPRYKCLTTPDGLVPIKAVIARPDGVNILDAPSPNAGVKYHAKAMTPFVVLTRGEYYKLGTDPKSDQAVGWVHHRDLHEWTTKEGLQPNYANADRRPLLLWEDKRHIGNEDEEHFVERPDNAQDQPFPVSESDDGRYRIVLRWQSDDYQSRGVTRAWTDRVAVPDDVRFFYLTTKDDVREMFENVNQALLELNSAGASDHPLIKFYNEHVAVTVGEEIDMKEDDLPTLRRVLRDLRNPISIAEKQPAEIRRDAERMRRDLKRLREFYQNPEHWNDRGEGWLPREYLPGR